MLRGIKRRNLWASCHGDKLNSINFGYSFVSVMQSDAIKQTADSDDLVAVFSNIPNVTLHPTPRKGQQQLKRTMQEIWGKSWTIARQPTERTTDKIHWSSEWVQDRCTS